MAETLKARPRRRWFGRWLIKLALWFVTLSGVVIAITIAVALFAYWNLTGLANFALSKFVYPYRVELGRVDVEKEGVIRLGKLRIRPPKDFLQGGSEPWVTLAGVDLAYDWTELRREHRFRSIVLRNPIIRIDDASLEVLGLNGASREGEGSDSVAPPFDLRSLGKVTDRIEIVSGELVVDTSQAPRLEASWDASVPAIDFAGADWLNADPLMIRLSDLKLGKGGSGGSIDRVAAVGRIRSDLRGLEIARLSIENPRLRISPDWFPTEEADEKESSRGHDRSGKSPIGSRTPFQILMGVFEVRGGVLNVTGFEATPEIRLKTEIDWRDLTIEGGKFRSGAPLTLAVSDLEVGSAARAARIMAVFDPAALLDRLRVESIAIEAAQLKLTPETVRGTAASEGGAVPAPKTVTHESVPRKNWEIGSVTLRGSSLEAKEWQLDKRKIPDLTVSGIEADLRALSAASFDAENESSTEDAEQLLRLSGIWVGDETNRPLSVDSLLARFRFGSLLREKNLEALTVGKPVLQLTDETLAGWFEDAGGEAAKEDESATSESPAIWKVNDLAVTDGELHLDTRMMDGRLPKLDGSFSIAKAGEETAGEDQLYRLKLQGLSVRQQEPLSPRDQQVAPPSGVRLGGLFPNDISEHPSAKVPGVKSIGEQDVALLRELSIDFTPAGIQRDQRIERIEVKGGELQVGDALRSMVNGTGVEVEPEKGASLQQSPQPAPQVGGASAAKTDDGKKGWRIGEMVVTETQVRFQALIPQIEGLEFAIETKLKDVPLNQGGLLTQESIQKVEIAGIEIRDPYDGFITVATLPTIFVEFSLAGLLSQRVDKIDLINPSIFVGQGMFWWVDYQRNYRLRNEGTTFSGPAANPVAPEDIDAGSQKNWEIREINAHFGKIVLAPAGRPIGIVPFPFSASTNLSKGEIALKLQIPKEQQFVYRFPDLKLDLYGLEGNVEFNVPIKQESNNLVQTFTLERAVWKQHEATKLFLTVTYDQKGVYGRFGGEAYGGYAQGQFNAYLDDLGKWDAWIAGTKMDMGPITQVLAPENFLMEGKVDAKLISQGRGLVFGETWGDLRTLSPGRIDVTKVNELIENLPESWSEMKRSATQLGLETIKDFEYQSGKGDLYFMNRDGWLKLDLRGPAGSRVLEAYAHDWRGRDTRSIEEKLAEFDPEITKPQAGALTGQPKVEVLPMRPERSARRDFRGRR